MEGSPFGREVWILPWDRRYSRWWNRWYLVLWPKRRQIRAELARMERLEPPPGLEVFSSGTVRHERHGIGTYFWEKKGNRTWLVDWQPGPDR